MPEPAASTTPSPPSSDGTLQSRTLTPNNAPGETEPTPMLDVHPPHHAAGTWRDFFIHIATIVIGLLMTASLGVSRYQRAILRLRTPCR
jgi:hypothetical protein